MKSLSTLSPLLLALVILGCGCKKYSCDEEVPLSAYLVFGHYYGECEGDHCIMMYKLTDSELLEDQKDRYAGRGFGSFKKMEQEKFKLADGLAEKVPVELIRQESQTFGCPDCADQGGLYILYARGTLHKEWRIDQDTGAVPTYLHSFVDEVNRRIALLRE